VARQGWPRTTSAQPTRSSSERMRCDTADGVTMQRARRALEAAFADDGGQGGERGVVEHGFSFASSD
jgi:hypothetical protein